MPGKVPTPAPEAPAPASPRERGRMGAARRWGPPRVIRLDDLAPEQRAFIAELVDVARRNAPASASGTE